MGVGTCRNSTRCLQRCSQAAYPSARSNLSPQVVCVYLQTVVPESPKGLFCKRIETPRNFRTVRPHHDGKVGGQKTRLVRSRLSLTRAEHADMLFPGTSTIQTRARYFLFIPWIYRGLERQRTSSARVPLEAREREVALTDAIVGSEDSDGVFGKRSRRNLKRLPSSVYSQGLSTWGIRLRAPRLSTTVLWTAIIVLSGAASVRTTANRLTTG
jgi:hypothetical protein